MKKILVAIDKEICKIEIENILLKKETSQFTKDGKWIAAIISDNEVQIKRLRTAKQILK